MKALAPLLLLCTGLLGSWFSFRSHNGHFDAASAAAETAASPLPEDFERGRMAREIISTSPPATQLSGDSLKQSFTLPMSLVMRVYEVKGGQLSLTQSSVPTRSAKKFHYGYLLHPEEGGHRIDFIFSDLDHPATETGHTLHLEKERRAVLARAANSGGAFMHDLVRDGEQVILYRTPNDKAQVDCVHQSLPEIASSIRSGYVVTAEARPVEAE